MVAILCRPQCINQDAYMHFLNRLFVNGNAAYLYGRSNIVVEPGHQLHLQKYRHLHFHTDAEAPKPTFMYDFFLPGNNIASFKDALRESFSTEYAVIDYKLWINAEHAHGIDLYQQLKMKHAIKYVFFMCFLRFELAICDSSWLIQC